VNDLVDQSINDFVVCDDNWVFGSDFDEARNLHRLLDHLLNLIYLGNFVDNLHDLILIGSNLIDLFIYLGHGNNLLLNHFHLVHFFGDVGHNLLNLFDFFVHNWLLLYLCDFLHDCYFLNNFNDLLDLVRNFFDFLNFLLN
jgi:hypothetical protein